MKRWGVFLAALALAAAAAGQTASEDRAELMRLETVWNQAHERGDAEALEKLWADDLEVAVPKMPIISRADAVALARSGRMHFERYQTSEIKVRLYEHAAVVTGRLQRTRTRDGQRYSDDWRFTKVYIQTGGTWRVVAFHASEAATPGP